MALIAAHLNAGVILVVTCSVAIGIILSTFSLLFPSLISPMVSVDVKHHVYLLTYLACCLTGPASPLSLGCTAASQPWESHTGSEMLYIPLVSVHFMLGINTHR